MQIIEPLIGLRVAAVLGVPWSFESDPVIRRYLVSIGVEKVPILVIWRAFLVVIELSSRRLVLVDLIELVIGRHGLRL